MPSRANYSRDRYPRSRSRVREPRGDAVTVSLTVRVGICAALLLCVWAVGKFGADGGRSFREGYRALTAEQQISWIGEGAEAASGLWGRCRTAAGGWVQAIVHRLTGSDRGAEEAAPPPGEQPADSFDYDYLGAEEVSLESGGGEHTALSLFAEEDESRRYDPADATAIPVAASLGPPVGGRVTSPFAWRDHPVTGSADFHNGLDIAAEEGRVVLAALPGTVSEVGWSEIYGNYILLSHADHLETSYSHLSEIIVEEGMVVKQGERIGKVGQTGMVTGPHLHFSVLVDGAYTDPAEVLGEYIRTVGG